MDKKQRQLANKYLDLFFRRKEIIIIILLLSLPAGLGAYLVTPKVYQASSLLSYQQQKINPNKLSPDLITQIKDTVSSLTQIVTSRTNLENIISTYNLYPELRRTLPMEDVVDAMRKQIKIEPSDQGDIFQIIFRHGSPEHAVKVTNALAAKFIEENLKYREERATETSSYTSDELHMAKEIMDKKESTMRDYKVRHYNEMPEQRDTNVARLIALQKQYQDKQDSIQDLERTIVLIQDQISNRKKLRELQQDIDEKLQPAATDTAEEKAPPLTNAQRLAKLQANLNQLQMKYTEKHPEVRRVRGLIERTKKEIAAGGESNISTSAASSAPSSGNIEQTVGGAGDLDQVVLQLEAQRKNVLLNIDGLKEEMAELKREIAEYNKWVAATPVREAEWSALTREYNQLKKHYDYLVAQDLEAKSALNLEKRQKGSQFKVEDPARIPEKPIKPNFMMIMAMALLGGLGLGAGGVLAVDFFDSTVRDPEQIEVIMLVPLLSTIPYVETQKEQRTGRKRSILFICLFLSGILVDLGLFFVVWQKGLIVI